jgi:bifunctional UDP-N-acetylglucosamine pyrophosphorylase/glucosamine-1-phosphate N-acetyltransferase
LARKKCLGIVLAAGEGTRMRSSLPKVLHKIAGREMLAHVLAQLKAAAVDEIAVVVGPGREDVAACARRMVPNAQIFVQSERRGTAHAVLAARAAIAAGADEILVAFADTPLISQATFAKMRAAIADGAAVAALGFRAARPDGYGRLINQGEELIAIREHKDATADERKITLCNAGVMALSGAKALKILDAIGCANAQNEFYLPDAVEVARAGGDIAAYVEASETEVMGVNDRAQLAAAEAVFQNAKRMAAMQAGATLSAPETVFFSYDTELGRDVTIGPFVVFGPGVKIPDGTIVPSFSQLPAKKS